MAQENRCECFYEYIICFMRNILKFHQNCRWDMVIMISKISEIWNKFENLHICIYYMYT